MLHDTEDEEEEETMDDKSEEKKDGLDVHENRGKDTMGSNCAIRPLRTQRERVKRTRSASAQELEELYAYDWTVDAKAMKAMKATRGLDKSYAYLNDFDAYNDDFDADNDDNFDDDGDDE
eukprot:16343799-Heterocapsa_arctica.AAC.1